MTRPLGHPADRGVHTRAGDIVVPILTPDLGLMCCRRCRRRGVKVIAVREQQLLGWCDLDHSRLDGLRVPVS